MFIEKAGASRTPKTSELDECSILEYRQLELAEAFGVGDYVDLDDLPASDRKTECTKQPSTRSHDDSHRSVYERQSCEARAARVGERSLGPSPRTADLPRYAARAVSSDILRNLVRIRSSETGCLPRFILPLDTTAYFCL